TARGSDSAVRQPRTFAARRGKVLERLETHHLEKPHRRPIKLWLPGSRATPDLRDQVAQLEVAEHAFAVDSPDLLDARPGNRLLIGDDGEGLIRCLGEAARHL